MTQFKINDIIDGTFRTYKTLFMGKDSSNEFYPKRKSVKANWNTTCHTQKHQQGVKLKSKIRS